MEPTPKLTPSEGNSDKSDEEGHLYLYIALGVIGLLALGGPLLAWILAGSATDAVSDLQKQFKGDVGGSLKKLRSLEEENSALRRQLNAINDKVTAHANAINKIAMMSKDLKGQLIEVQAGAQLESLQVLRSERPFPKPVDEIISEYSAESRSVALDDLTKCLVESPGRGDHFALFQADLGGSDMAYVVPRVSRFNTKNDYLNFYQKFYRCDVPAAGEVWIKELAVVKKVPQGWELHKAGELEVK